MDLEKNIFNSYQGILSQEIKYLKNVGPSRASILNKELKIKTIQDLLFYFPRKHIDCSRVYSISELYIKIRSLNETLDTPFIDQSYIQLEGFILNLNEYGVGRKKILKGIFSDGTGYIDLIWFGGLNKIKKNIKLNFKYKILGKPNLYNNTISISHPELDNFNLSNSIPFKPIYRLPDTIIKKGINQSVFMHLILNALCMIEQTIIEETLPEYFTLQYKLLPINKALKIIHFPTTLEEIQHAIFRFKFEELFYLQLRILRNSYNNKVQKIGYIFKYIGNNFLYFYNHLLPFKLTNAQKKVIKEIRYDIGCGKQMNRLLQGDVGSGKTIVALLSCLIAIDNNFQACILAPTEILAEQHFYEIHSLLKNTNLQIELLTSNIKGKKRINILSNILSGKTNILIGTHALLESSVIFKNLGLAIIDEQHRFGVEQRSKLWKKNILSPHILIMTATPIPRTLSMTLYGDLDVSIINELPPGRTPIKTLHYYFNSMNRVLEIIENELIKGKQIYIVYPLIKENEKIDLKNAEDGYENFKQWFKKYKVGLVHGKQKNTEKEEQMNQFVSHKTDILVSTTVIEVGVNVPNATIMIIMHAERFGLSQLHQLRGRVGRGNAQSFCILVTSNQLKKETLKRIQIMCETTNGFEIAEEDLKLRGPGDIEGTAQSGIQIHLKYANLVQDSSILQKARKAANQIIQNDPKDNLPENYIFRKQLQIINTKFKDYSSIS